LNQYFTGDPSFLKTLQVNAISKSSIDPVESESTHDNRMMKRKREETEIRKMAVEIQAIKVKTQLASMDEYQALCVDTMIDERAKKVFKEVILENLTACIGVCL
jgi:hypothetical protein